MNDRIHVNGVVVYSLSAEVCLLGEGL